MDFIAINDKDFDQSPIIIRNVASTSEAYQAIARDTYRSREAEQPDYDYLSMEVTLYRIPEPFQGIPAGNAVMLTAEENDNDPQP